MFKYHMTLREG